jgi:CRP-like cAMP-binding protein
MPGFSHGSRAEERRYHRAVTRDEVLGALGRHLSIRFGALVRVRELVRRRSIMGESWGARLAISTREGMLPLAEIEVGDEGAPMTPFGPDELIAAIRSNSTESDAPDIEEIGGPPDDFLDGLVDSERESVIPESPQILRAQVDALLSSGTEDGLRRARDLMPRLLADPDRRGATLMKMGEVEMHLREPKLANGYLEAAAREFADRFDIPSLERCAALALRLLGNEAFPQSPIYQLLELGRARLRPVANLFDLPTFASVGDKQRAWLKMNTELRTLPPGEFLVREGEPSRAVFVIKSGLVSVLLDTGTSDPRMVRCCFPGWLLGESSVLVDHDPRCTASLRAERVTEVWVIDAMILREIMHESQPLAERIAATKHIHRIDSFFSMHETMGQLDVQVRDQMLGCLQRIETFEEDAVAIAAGEVPQVACLVARGELALFEGDDFAGAPRGIIKADSFFGVRDAMHQIPSGLTAIAKAGAAIAFFDASLLRALGEQSPEHVIAILERLG